MSSFNDYNKIESFYEIRGKTENYALVKTSLFGRRQVYNTNFLARITNDEACILLKYGACRNSIIDKENINNMVVNFIDPREIIFVEDDPEIVQFISHDIPSTLSANVYNYIGDRLHILLPRNDSLSRKEMDLINPWFITNTNILKQEKWDIFRREEYFDYTLFDEKSILEREQYIMPYNKKPKNHLDGE